MHKKMAALAAIAALTGAVGVASAQAPAMTFFVSSVPSGKGADFGGLAGADAFCKKLADAVGAGNKTWHAYLSTQAAGGTAAVNAKDRIGKGPWQNVKGVVIAKDVADLHSASNNLNKQTALTEKGDLVKGRGDQPNQHDILTGTKPDGTAFPPGDDKTCGNWTKSGDGAAVVGHHDRQGLPPPVPAEEAQSWNSSHVTQGCSAEVLPKTGGNGYLYCFAAN